MVEKEICQDANYDRKSDIVVETICEKEKIRK